MSKVLRSGSVRLQSNITRANSGKEGRQLLDAIADVHYFISVPEERPLHATFEKGTKVGLYLKEDTGKIRIKFVDAANPKGCALSGDISVLRLEFGNDQECFVRAEIDYGQDQGVSLGSDWMVSAPDEHNEGMHNWRPFCVDIYFWKHSMADYFVRIVDEYQKRLQAQAAEARRKASISEAQLPQPAAVPIAATPQNAEPQAEKAEPQAETKAAPDEDDEEMFKKNITSVDCLDCNNGEIFPVAGNAMECRVVKNQTKKTTKIYISSPIEGGHMKLVYTLTERSFPYQLPESTVQVRFMLVEKILTVNSGANMETIQNAAPLDSPIFQFEQDDHAQIFLECLRGEQLLLNSIVDWVRSTRDAKEGETSTAGPHPGNFTCVDDRRIQLWENELGFINIVFHRQFHLVSAFITPTTQVEAEAGASTLKISGIKIRKLEKSPNLDAKEPWKSDGTLGALKLRFAGPEHVASFRESVLTHRDATAILFPEVTKAVVQAVNQEPQEAKLPPPPPPEFRHGHGRSMSTSAAVPPPPSHPPNSPPQQFPASPQSPGPHQTSFGQYPLGHTQSVRMNRPPPLPMFSQQQGYVPGGLHSPRFQNGAQPSPMTGTFAPAGMGQFPISNFSPPTAPPPGAAPYQSPAAVANAQAPPPLSPMPNQSYFPTTITPMTPGLPSGKFPPLQMSLPPAPPGSHPPPTPIREHMRKNSFPMGPDSIQSEPVELPASFPDEPEPKQTEVKDQQTPAAKKFSKTEEDIPEEDTPPNAGYNPLGGNVSIGMSPGQAKPVATPEGGKMSRVWKKLK